MVEPNLSPPDLLSKVIGENAKLFQDISHPRWEAKINVSALALTASKPCHYRNVEVGDPVRSTICF